MLLKLTLTAVATAGFAFLCQGQSSGPDPKGIFVSGGSNSKQGATPAVKYGIQLKDKKGTTPVAASHHFKSGDQFRLAFEANQDRFAYILLRSVVGNPDTMENIVGTKGITVVRDEAQRQKENRYQMLWPQGGNTAVQLKAHQMRPVPSADWFEFDNEPGLEKLVVLVSPRELKPNELERLFPGSTGQAGKANSRNDTNDDVLAQLSKDIAAMDANTVTEASAESKGICVGECANYAAPRRSAEPFLVVIDLRHYR